MYFSYLNPIGAHLFHQVLILSSMSFFYQVMGAARCQKIKKHAGIKIKPLGANKSKDPYSPNDMLLFSCESTDPITIQSIKCLENGQWSDIPSCPDPTNFTCPDLGPLAHGTYNATGPYKVGSVVAFRCDNEQLPGILQIASQSSLTSAAAAAAATTTITTTTTTATTSAPASTPHLPVKMFSAFPNLTASTNQPELSFNLTGHRILRCLPSSKWNHPMPACKLVVPEPESTVGLLLTSALLVLIPILIIFAIFQLIIRWRKRQQQRERWKQYFTDYKYRHSKTSITFGLRQPQNNTSVATIPITDL